MAAAGVSASTYNPITTPFVADHTGYDILLDNTVVTVPPTGPTLTPTPVVAFNPIIGAWSLNSPGLASTVTFMADGHYMLSNGQVGANAVFLQVWPGLEYGTYAYNSSTGDLSIACASVDTNGTAGFTNSYSGGFDDSGVPIGTCTITPRSAAINGNVMTLTNLSNSNQNTFTRIADSTNPLVGSWAGPDKTVVTFAADGHYMLAQVAPVGSASTNQVWPGIEYGTYSWNAATGAMSASCAIVDTNGTAGLSNFTPADYRPFNNGLISSGNTPVGTVGGGQPTGACTFTNHVFNVTVVGNAMTVVFPSGTSTLNRVVYGNTASATPSNYAMSIKTSIRREEDFFPGNTSRFTTGMHINIDSVNSGGASPSTYDSVRVTGNGLPTTGLWYVRSALSGSFAVTTVRSATPQATTTLSQAMVCPDCGSFWMSRTKAVSGANAVVLDANPTGATNWSSTTDGGYTGATGVRPTQGTVYTFEIYKNASLVATETRTLQSNLVPAEQAVNLAWNNPGPNTLAALDVTNLTLNGIQNSMLIDWTQNPSAEQIQYVWVSETNGAGDNATSFPVGATSVLATPQATSAGATQFTGMTGTTNYTGPVYGGYREIGLTYQMSDGSSKSAVYVYYP
jgi:hypothetical protein